MESRIFWPGLNPLRKTKSANRFNCQACYKWYVLLRHSLQPRESNCSAVIPLRDALLVIYGEHGKLHWLPRAWRLASRSGEVQGLHRMKTGVSTGPWGSWRICFGLIQLLYKGFTAVLAFEIEQRPMMSNCNAFVAVARLAVADMRSLQWKKNSFSKCAEHALRTWEIRALHLKNFQVT